MAKWMPMALLLASNPAHPPTPQRLYPSLEPVMVLSTQILGMDWLSVLAVEAFLFEGLYFGRDHSWEITSQ